MFVFPARLAFPTCASEQDDILMKTRSGSGHALDKGDVLLEARGLSKGFPGVWEHLILDKLDFDVRSGEVHTLLGENGAGKTVIANILSGYYEKTEGEIRVKGKLVHFQDILS